MNWVTKCFKGAVEFHNEVGFVPSEVYVNESALNEADLVVPINYILTVTDDDIKPNFDSLNIEGEGILNSSVLSELIYSLGNNADNLFDMLSSDLPHPERILVKLALLVMSYENVADNAIAYYAHMLWAMKRND